MKMTQLDVCILACNHQLPRRFSKKGVDSGLYANKYLAFKIKWLQLATSLDCRAQPWQTGFASVGQNICKGAAKDLPPSKWCLGVARLPCTLLSFTQHRGGGQEAGRLCHGMCVSWNAQPNVNLCQSLSGRAHKARCACFPASRSCHCELEINFLPELYRMTHDSPWVSAPPIASWPGWTPFRLLLTFTDCTASLSLASVRRECDVFPIPVVVPWLSCEYAEETSSPWGNPNRSVRFSWFLTMPTASRQTCHLRCLTEVPGKRPVFLILSLKFLKVCYPLPSRQYEAPCKRHLRSPNLLHSALIYHRTWNWRPVWQVLLLSEDEQKKADKGNYALLYLRSLFVY